MTRMSRLLGGALFLVAALVLATPASAQTGGLRGKVTDPKGQPVEGAVVHIESKGMSRKLDVKTNKKGEYVQIGLYPGEYVVTAQKDNLKFSTPVNVSLGDPTVLDMQLAAGGNMSSKEADEINAKLRASFDAGIAATKAENYDEAIAKFTEAANLVPNCHMCYFNIGAVYVKKGDLAKAEEAYKKSVEINPQYADGWSALATIYNQQQKFDLATQASEKAAAAGGTGGGAGAAGAGGGTAATLYNQGVILWNQNKYAEAKDKFEAATKADPKYSEAFYRLGTAYMNLGDMPKAIAAFEGYLQADPNGQHAAEVKAALDALKPKQ